MSCKDVENLIERMEGLLQEARALVVESKVHPLVERVTKELNAGLAQGVNFSETSTSFSWTGGSDLRVVILKQPERHVIRIEMSTSLYPSRLRAIVELAEAISRGELE